jgi:hypothetical protein
VADILRDILMYVLLPLWSLSGLADWWCHRRTVIERTGGVGESVFHLAMFAQMAVAGLMALLLEVNSLVLLLLVLLFLTHEATVWFELRFVQPLRHISPTEQMVHSFMEIIPLGGIALLAGLHGQALLGLGSPGVADWQWRLKAEPLPAGYVLSAVAGIFVVNVLPLLEEFFRCWRARAVPKAA